jgi:hypothetical protein
VLELETIGINPKSINRSNKPNMTKEQEAIKEGLERFADNHNLQYEDLESFVMYVDFLIRSQIEGKVMKLKTNVERIDGNYGVVISQSEVLKAIKEI